MQNCRKRYGFQCKMVKKKYGIPMSSIGGGSLLSGIAQCYLQKIAFCSNYTYHSIFDPLQCFNVTDLIYFGNVMLREVAGNEKWTLVTHLCWSRFHTTK